MLLAEPLPASAIETAAPSEVIAAAKSLPQQEVDKPKVWLLLAGGSAVLFGVTVFLEKQTQLFPAISKANQAMSQSRTARQGGANTDQEQSAWDRLEQQGQGQSQQQQQQQWEDPEPVAVDSVLAGLQSASQRVLASETGDAQAEHTPANRPAASTASSTSGKSGEAASGMAVFNSSAANGSAAPLHAQPATSSTTAEQASTPVAAPPTDNGAAASAGPPAAQPARPSVAAATSEQPAAAADGRDEDSTAHGSSREEHSEVEPPASHQDKQLPAELLGLSDEELEKEIAKRQQPVDLSQLSDDDLQRELSKRQLAAGIVENVLDS
jgi:hypothetical protein